MADVWWLLSEWALLSFAFVAGLALGHRLGLADALDAELEASRRLAEHWDATFGPAKHDPPAWPRLRVIPGGARVTLFDFDKEA